MVDIIGSIDNAYQGKISVKVYHLIFTASTMYKCDVMGRKDLRQSCRNYLKQNPIARYSSVLEKVFGERFISKYGSAEDGSMQR